MDKINSFRCPYIKDKKVIPTYKLEKNNISYNLENKNIFIG